MVIKGNKCNVVSDLPLSPQSRSGRKRGGGTATGPCSSIVYTGALK